MKKLRIFISSPSDVLQERLIAKKVIANLNRIYSRYVELETIMWEDLPLEATASFQEGIDYFLEKAPVDVAIFILWSRLGSKLGQSFKKPDGSEYMSGTEYEFDMMYALWEQTKRPKIMVYVKDAEPQFVGGSNLGDVKEALEQRDRLQSFIEENFKDRETGTNYAYWQFDKQQTFEERLKTHLTHLIHDQLDNEIHIKEWDGNPYVGLRSYEESESTIFCGRQSLIYDIAEHWIEQNETYTQKPLLVLGESGSGKSSLVKAGLIPYLHNMSTDKITYKVDTMIPSEFRGNVYQGVVKKLLDVFPHLGNNPVGTDLVNGIAPDYDFKYLQFAISAASSNNVTVFFIDQFEELFNDTLINEDEKKKTVQLLNGLCLMPHLWIIISMRNDFYSKFTSYPEFGSLKNKAYIVDVPNVSATDISDIVKIPAKKANLSWDINEYGEKLSKIIVREANEIKDLPLIEFGLAELFNSKTGDKLTFTAYEKIGKLKGAVAKYADNFYESLSDGEKKEFEQLLGAVITVSSQDESKYVRKTSRISDIAKTNIQKSLIKKLTDAHLFVGGKDADGEPTITLVHEMLFSTWDVVMNWISNQKEFLKKNNYYENLTRVWVEKGNRDADLVQERSQLLEAEYFMFRNGNKALRPTRDYLNKSLRRQSGKGLAKYLFFFAVALFCTLSYLVLALLKMSNYDVSEFFPSEDMREMVESAMSWDSMLFMIMLLIISVHAVLLRIIKKPKYKTIGFTISLCMICTVICFISICADIYHNITEPEDYSWYSLLIYMPFLMVGINVITEYQRRQLWKKSVFKTYLLADNYYKIREYVIWVFVAMAALFTLLLYVLAIIENNEELDKAIEQNESTLQIADELFDGLNNIQGQLSWPDRLYINEKRIRYLADRFYDELLDTIPDRREGQVAVCYYNLYNPLEASKYLYPFKWWDHEILIIKAWMKAGAFNLAGLYMESYLNENDTEDYPKYTSTSYASTHDLIWVAEKLGRFDLAEELYELLSKYNEDISNNTALLMNYGHIQLMNGHLEDAMKYYSYAQNAGITAEWPKASVEDRHKYIKSLIASDFSLFHWFDVGDKEMIRKAANQLNIQYNTSFYTSPADSTFTDQMQAKLVGAWALADSSIVLEFNDVMPTCLYKVFDKGKNEIARELTNCRYSTHDGKVYIEELNQDNDNISSGEITTLSGSELSIRIIENGNPKSKNTVRRYYKIIDNDETH